MKKSCLIIALLAIGLLAGCTQNDELETYEVNTPNYTNGGLGLNASSDASVSLAADNNVFTLNPLNDKSQRFFNYSAGYEVDIPADFAVLDMADARYRSTLGNKTTRLDIFTQRLDLDTTSAETYLNYSNTFLENTEEFHKTYDHSSIIDGAMVHELAWSRRPLSRVKNDRPYYATIDVVKEDRVVSFQLSSTAPLSENTLHRYTQTLKLTAPQNNAKDYPRFPVVRNNLNEETRAFYTQTFSEEAPLTWGLFEPTVKANDSGNLTALEDKLGYHFNILLYYSGVQKTFKPGYIYDTLTTIRNSGAVCELTLQTLFYDPKTESNAVYDILNGNYDDFLHAYAQEVADFGHPVLFRPFNEMNGGWCNYSAFWAGRDCNTYVELYRYLYRIFEEHGANANTLWVWNPNERAFPTFSWNAADNYYPGDQYVDIVGITGYNTGTYYEGETWRSFDDIYAPIYNETAPQYKQPLMITEFACSGIGGDKAAWVKDMLTRLDDYPRIKAAIWWNSADFDEDGTIARSYYIDDNDDAFAAFKSYLTDHS